MTCTLQNPFRHRSLHIPEERRIAPQQPHGAPREENAEQRSPSLVVPDVAIEGNPFFARLWLQQRTHTPLRVDQWKHEFAKRGEVTLELARPANPALDYAGTLIPIALCIRREQFAALPVKPDPVFRIARANQRQQFV